MARIDTDFYDNLTTVAKHVGVPRQTLASAVTRDEVKHVQLGISGTALVNINSAQVWANNKSNRRTGPKVSQ